MTPSTPALFFLAALAFAPLLHAKDKNLAAKKPVAPPVIPFTGSGRSTTTKLGSSHVTRSPGGEYFKTSQLGSSVVTRDSKGNTWTTGKFGHIFVARGPGDQQQAPTKFGNSSVTRDSKAGIAFTTSPLGNSLHTRGNPGAPWSRR